MSLLTYTRQSDGTFKREGEVTERYVTIVMYRDGLWSKPLAPVRRTKIVELIEAHIREKRTQYLPADIYKLEGVERLMSAEDTKRLKELNKKNKSKRKTKNVEDEDGEE